MCGPNLGAAGVQPAAGAANSGALGALANFGSAGWQFSEKKTPPFNYIIAINYYIVNNVLYLVMCNPLKSDLKVRPQSST